MARIQILSDLHLEFPSAYDLFDIPAQAPYLALLGDIGNVKDDNLFTFIKAQLAKLQIVFFLWVTMSRIVPIGQPCGTECKPSLTRSTRKETSRKPKTRRVRFPESNPARSLFDVTILGCTLYSQVTKAQEDHVSFGLNDFYHIRDWTVEDHCAAHQSDLEWLNQQVSEIVRSDPHRKIVVFTYHSPVAGDSCAVDPVHANSPISPVFATDLTGSTC